MIFGGIPHYLSLIRKGQSAEQCIDEICFQKGGILIDEFNRLFAALFNDADSYIHLIRSIANHPRGISQANLIKESGASDGGRTKTRLNALANAGFIIDFIPYGYNGKGTYYKIIDEFTLFYLRWVEPNLTKILRYDQNQDYWLSKTKSPGWQAWAGLAFESLCYKHLSQIRKALTIPSGADVGSWQYAPKQNNNSGAQIDLLFDKHDNVITLCEIKYNDKPFLIDKAYAKKLQNKLSVFQQQNKTDKQLFLSFIVASGLKPSMYAEDMVDGVVNLNDLFHDS